MRRIRIMLLALCFTQCVIAHDATAQDYHPQTVDSAVWQLRRATLLHRNGQHQELIRALRQLRDPQLAALFAELVQRPVPELRIHGILGLAEIDPNEKLDLALLAELKNHSTQARLVSAAMDEELIDRTQAKQLIEWPGLHSAVKLLVAADLMAHGTFDDRKLLGDLVTSDNLALMAMSAMLVLELDRLAAMDQVKPVDPALVDQAVEALEKLNRTDAVSRDSIRVTLLQKAFRYEYTSMASWAMAVARDNKAEQAVQLTALRVAMRLGAPEAAASWRQHFAQSTDSAQRRRLAVMAVDMARYINDARVFVDLIEANQADLKQLGRVGQMIMEGHDASRTVLGLLHIDWPMLWRWVLSYAQRMPAEQADVVFLGMIDRALQEESLQRDGRFLEMVVLASQWLAENSETSVGPLRERLAQSQDLVQEAMLIGLIQARDARAAQVIADPPQWTHTTARSLAVLLRAKHGLRLDRDQIRELSLIVRGGAGLQNPLRVQAAWLYLKITDQQDIALAKALTP